MATFPQWARDAVTRVPDLLRRRLPAAGEADRILNDTRETLRDSLRHGAVIRHFLGSQVDVVVDEIETPAPTGSAHGREVVPAHGWARRMTVSSARAPHAHTVVVLHRQSAPGSPLRRRFPVVVLVGRIETKQLLHLLTVPDAEEHLPRLTHAEDGRIVVDRRESTADEQRRADDLDEIMGAISRDPRVATLLHDWLSDSAR